MKNNRTVHEVAFRLNYDLITQMEPQLKQLDRKLAPLQLRAMRQIWFNTETTLLDIVMTLKRDKGQVTRLVDELCTLEMVKKIKNPNDGRSKLLKLTQQGRAFFESIEKIELSFSDQLKKGISEKELNMFFSVSDKLSENIRNMAVLTE
ncbi:MarR family transcriptional regulator [uncultured Shewanella sp.]|uniref:MarR family winged helix-turn-helix transcriptional regulator n=1 Tax=uncultured Shewanella sp. TaxID=173975 RepID=UPI0026319CC2|nr:MarR family transcriptional regulator [uncultured Shewanella sp.]